MTLWTLVQYLFGSREAILRIARSPQALWIGLVFVFAAALAREYDGADLLHEPWHLFLPLAASLVTSAVLYLLVRLVFWLRGSGDVGWLVGYRTFLTLYWMTAPLALLYAIPFERIASAGDATSANLWLLGLVAFWRVVLITRAISVIYGTQYHAALAIVLLFADSVLLAAVKFMPKPIIEVMSGVRLSEAESTIFVTTLLVFFLGTVSWPIWLISTLTVAWFRQPPWQFAIEATAPGERVSPLVWVAAIAAVCGFFPILPFRQAEQIMRHEVESALAAGKIRLALELMSRHGPSDFPPHWDPPPRIGYREAHPEIAAVQEQLAATSAAHWVRKVYDAKYINWLRGELEGMGRWQELPPAELERQVSLLEKLADRREIVIETEWGLSERMEHASEPLRTRIQRLLDEAGIRRPDKPAADLPAQQSGEPDNGSNSP